MARNRTLYKSYFAAPTTGVLSHAARLIDLGITTLADDEGLLLWDPASLRGALFARDELATLDRVAAWMREVQDAGIVHVYTSTRAPHPIAFIVEFRRGPLAQRPDRPGPASLPPPNWRDPATALVFARRDEFLCAVCGEPVNEQFAPDADLARFNPVCERIKPPAPGKAVAGADDPTNVRTVHAVCARTPAPGGLPELRAPIPGVFGERSSNARRVIAESAPHTPTPEPRPAQVIATPAPARITPAPMEIRRALDEHSTKTGEEWESAAEPPVVLDGGLFPLDEPPAAKPKRPRAAKDPDAQARAELAQNITATWWEHLETKPAKKGAFIGVKKIVERLLEVGHAPDAITHAIEECGYAVTIDALQLKLRLAEERAGRAAVTSLDSFRTGSRTQSTTDRKLANLRTSAADLEARLLGGNR